jgi:hypothetical protein
MFQWPVSCIFRLHSWEYTAYDLIGNNDCFWILRGCSKCKRVEAFCFQRWRHWKYGINKFYDLMEKHGKYSSKDDVISYIINSHKPEVEQYGTTT